MTRFGLRRKAACDVLPNEYRGLVKQARTSGEFAGKI